MAVAIGDCYRIDTSKYDSGVYRVVGTGDPVALLRIGDSDDRRVHTGNVIYLPPREVEQLEAAEEPSKTFAQRVSGRLRLLPFEIRTTIQRAKQTPVVTGGSLLLIAVGLGLDQLADAGLVSDVVLLAGGLGLATSISLWYNYKVRDA